jgi:glycosyltransferase involved in cell wall biosynthesis
MEEGRRGSAELALSVITPSFDSARFIEETLDSVRKLQTPHEHIVIDGGSRDGTVELLAARADPSLSWTSEPDRGQTHAVNKGLEQACGELVAWLNADDAYLPEHIDAAVELLLSDRSLDAVFGHMDVVDAEGRSVKRYRCGEFRWNRYLYFGEYLPTPTIIFRRSLLKRAGHLDERYADSADYDFYLRVLRGANVVNVRRPLVRFRYHADSKTASDPARQKREGLEIRLRYARTGIERVLMRAVDRVARARTALISPWPDLPQQR